MLFGTHVWSIFIWWKGVLYHHGPLNLTTIFHLFRSIKLLVVGIIYNKKVGNFIELAKLEFEPEELATKKPMTSSSSNHVDDSMWSTFPPNNTLSPNEANPPDVIKIKIALGVLVTFFMKKRGVVIEKVEVKDTETTIAVMVGGGQHKRAKRSYKVFLQKIGIYTLT